MRFKIRKVGTSFGILLPKAFVEPFLEKMEIELVLPGEKSIIMPEDVRTEPIIMPEEKKTLTFERCKKHKGSYTYSCGCA